MFVRWYYLPTCEDRTIPVLVSIIEVSYISKINYLQTLNRRYIYSNLLWIENFLSYRSHSSALEYLFYYLFKFLLPSYKTPVITQFFKDLADKNNSVVLYITTAKSQWDNIQTPTTYVQHTFNLKAVFLFFKLLQFPKKKTGDSDSDIRALMRCIYIYIYYREHQNAKKCNRQPFTSSFWAIMKVFSRYSI